MQQSFFKSPIVFLLAILDIKNSYNGITPGGDNIAFTTYVKDKDKYLQQKIKKIRYSYKSLKNYKIEKRNFFIKTTFTKHVKKPFNKKRLSKK